MWGFDNKGIVLLLGLLACSWAGSAAAQPQTGDFFITEFSSGEVTNIRAGGDMSAVAPFAWGILNPSGLCRGPNDDMYVAGGDPNGGVVYVITNGGDISTAQPFATSPPAPTSLLCTDTQVLVTGAASISPNSEVYDITAGGDCTSASPFAHGFGGLSKIFQDASGTRWGVTYLGTVFDFTAGGDVSGSAHATNVPGGASGLAEFGGALYVGSPGSGCVYDFTAGGDLSSAMPFAYAMDEVKGLFGLDGFGLYAADASGSSQTTVHDASAGGDATSSVFAFGLGSMFGEMLYWHGCGDNIVWAAGGEECDDGNTTDGDGCSSACATEGAGGAGPGGAGGTGGTGATGGAGGIGGTGGGGGTAGPSAGEPDDDSGCGCRVVAPRSSPVPWAAVGLLALAVGLTRRRKVPSCAKTALLHG